MKTKARHFPVPEWDNPQNDVLMMDVMDKSNRELDQLYLEAQEYDFLVGKTPQAMPDFWEDEN